MASEFAPLIYVDLIKEKPADFTEWWAVKSDMPETAARSTHQRYVKAFQPWRIMILSGDNQARLFRSTERYFNRADALHAVELAFGPGSNVYLREKEHGNVLLRMGS